MQPQSPRAIFAKNALTDVGWQRDVRVEWDAGGLIAQVTPNTVAVGALTTDLLLAGINNVHSHVFQRAMVGLTETASGAGRDNFWSWREVMYAFTHTLTPEHIEIIARAFFIDLMKHGYTGVGEFHYLHHDANGTPYANPAELSERIIAAAMTTGIHLTHLPVMYETANFGGASATSGQCRFLHSPDSFLTLIETLRKKYPALTLGIAPHSLRAVTPESLKIIIEALPSLGLADCPIHIHIAEQEKEVADCMAWSGKRPLAWLMENHPIDPRWCLIHATHIEGDEVAKLAMSGAVAGLCPTTEANLGDGIFPAEAYLAQGGKFGVGSDSQVCVSPFEELRQLEYAQRLITRKRNVLHGEFPSVGRTLYANAATGGAQALGIKSGRIAVGYRADLLALAMDHSLLADKQDDQILDALIFSLTPNITDVFVAGNHTVKNRKHALEESASAALRRVMQELRK
jgi:formimidoylglutamate deiminase